MDEQVLEEFYKIITPNKVEMFERIAPLRSKYITVAMENIHQEHNASAVLRSCDCFGIQALHVIESKNEYLVQRDIARGAGKWVDMYTYDNENTATADCIKDLRAKGYKIVATTPHKDAKPIGELDLSQPVALVFGTEQDGISEEVKNLSDEFVTIPMYGFTESFNISVSAAVILSTLRQRLENSDLDWKISENEQLLLKIEWCKRILNGGPELDTHYRKLIAENRL